MNAKGVIAAIASIALLVAIVLYNRNGDEGEGSPESAAERGQTSSNDEALRDPSLAKQKAPDKFRVRFKTTKGDIVFEAVRAWSPNGVDRLYNLVKIGFFEDIAFFRCVPNFVLQFGMHGDPALCRTWNNASFLDDPVVESNKLGYLTFAKTGMPNSRSSQFFINLAHNSNLDEMGFAPIARVVEGLTKVGQINTEYGERPNQQLIEMRGNAYLEAEFPRLDYIRSAAIE